MDSYAAPFFNNTSESLLVPAPDKNFIRRAAELASSEPEANTFFVKSSPVAVTAPRNVVAVFCALVHTGIEVEELVGKAEGHKVGKSVLFRTEAGSPPNGNAIFYLV
jgi:hypothetical protein